MGAADPESDGPARSFEVEVKFDVDDDTPLPDLSRPARRRVASARRSRATSTPATSTPPTSRSRRAGYALRRRTGGPDAGWHIKGPRIDGGRASSCTGR